MKKTLWLILSILLAAALHTHAATLSIQSVETSGYDTWMPEKGNTLTLRVSVTDAPSEGELQFSTTGCGETCDTHTLETSAPTACGTGCSTGCGGCANETKKGDTK